MRGMQIQQLWVYSTRAQRARSVLVLSLSVCLYISSARAASVSPEAKTIFRKRCTACHTFGKGVKIGPDLKGVNERRNRDWLLAFIQGSSVVIQRGDPTATKLFQEFKRERMPDWTDLSAEQIDGLLAFFAANGPEQKDPDERDATTATAEEVRKGQALFHGDMRFTYNGQACATCHQALDQKGLEGGTLGPDLTDFYRSYQDKAVTVFLRRPCFSRVPEVSQDRYLTPEEIFFLKAYLAQASKLHQTSNLVNASRLAKGGAERR